MKILLVLCLLCLPGCAAAPLSLGTGHAATDIILGEFIREGASALIRPVFASSDDPYGWLPPSAEKITVVRGVPFAGSWR